MTALRDRDDHDGAVQAEAKLTEIQDAIDGITRQAANIRAGHVYVISDIGAFGQDIVKLSQRLAIALFAVVSRGPVSDRSVQALSR